MSGSCVLLPIILVVLFVSKSTVISQRDVEGGNLVPLSSNCSNLSVVHFLSYFPCVNISSEEEFKECDIFAYVAAEMAVERINTDDEVLSNAELKLASIYDLKSSNSELSIDSLFQVLNVLKEDKVKESLWGIVGPLTTQQARIASVFSIENTGVMMVSYTARDPGLNNPTNYRSTFYRSLPSDNVISDGILSLLREFQWYRIGVINSQQPPYTQMVENFRKSHTVINNNIIDIPVQKSFALNSHSFSFLQILQKHNVRVIVGFFGPDEARQILCVAKAYGLTTPNHVWILPAYYNPEWWKSPSPQHANNPLRDSGCSNNEMMEILNKLVIFIDGVKYPTVDLSMADFNLQIINQTKLLFPSLSDVDLSRYLLHSRATSAYDAVMLLARSLDIVVDIGGDLCHDPLRIQTALERCLIDCEQCRLFSGCSDSHANNNSFTDCDMCTRVQKNCDLNYTFDDLRRPDALNSYGQVLVSQFIDGRDCPISIYWGTDTQLTKLSNFTHHSCAGQRLGLTRNETFPGIESCPTDFQWNSGAPPSSNTDNYSFIPLAELIPVAVVSTLGLICGAGLLVFTVVWRNNRHVKALSPRLNIVFIFGFFLLFPSLAIYDGLILSAVVYNVPEWLRTPLCQLQIWAGFLGSGLILATLVVKNWRIYRIFNNKNMRKKKEQLSDNALLVGILILNAPLLLLLVGWTAHSTHKYLEKTLENDSVFEAIIVTYCGSSYSVIWIECVSAYQAVLLLVLFLLSTATIRVPTQFSHEGRAAQRVVLINLVIIPILCLVDLILKLNPSQWHKAWWIGVFWSLVFPICLLGALFLPQVYSVVADHYHQKKVEYRKKYSKGVADKYEALVGESLHLRKLLEEMDKELQQLKSTRSKANSNKTCMLPKHATSASSVTVTVES